MCFDYDGYNECEVTIIRKARKRHQCEECCKLIEKGDKYEYCSGIYDSKPFSFKTCSNCVDLRSKISAIELSRGCRLSESVPPAGELLEVARELGLI